MYYIFLFLGIVSGWTLSTHAASTQPSGNENIPKEAQEAINAWKARVTQAWLSHDIRKKPEFITVSAAMNQTQANAAILTKKMNDALNLYTSNIVKINALNSQTDQQGYTDLDQAYNAVSQQFQTIFQSAATSINGLLNALSANLVNISTGINALSPRVAALWNQFDVTTAAPTTATTTTAALLEMATAPVTATTTAASTTASSTAASSTAASSTAASSTAASSTTTATKTPPKA